MTGAYFINKPPTSEPALPNRTLSQFGQIVTGFIDLWTPLFFVFIIVTFYCRLLVSFELGMAWVLLALEIT